MRRQYTLILESLVQEEVTNNDKTTLFNLVEQSFAQDLARQDTAQVELRLAQFISNHSEERTTLEIYNYTHHLFEDIRTFNQQRARHQRQQYRQLRQ